MSEKTPLKLSGNSIVLPINRETGTVDDPDPEIELQAADDAAADQVAPVVPEGARIQTINDWEPEVRSLLEALIAANCVLVSGDNGEDKFVYKDGELAAFIEELIACDEAHLYVLTPGGKERWLYLVLGNSPGELVSDYTVDATIDKVSSAESDKWSGKAQPTKRGYYDHGRSNKFVVVP